MTTVVISQPMLFPWPGFFEQMMLADTYLFLDDTQFSKGSFTNRVQIKSKGTVKWLTVALENSGTFQRIDQLRPAHSDWKERQLDTLRRAYSQAPFAKDALELAQFAYSRASMCDVLIASIESPASYLGIGTAQLRSKTSLLEVAGRSSNRVLDLVKQVQGKRYVTGHGAARYLDHMAFERQGIAVDYMDYSKTQWPQEGTDFTPFVTVLDLIANTGPQARSYLRPSTTNWRVFTEGVKIE
jgi:WbqC-like protein family